MRVPGRNTSVRLLFNEVFPIFFCGGLPFLSTLKDAHSIKSYNKKGS